MPLLLSRFVGIDPGVSGGVAIIDADRDVYLLRPMPETGLELMILLRDAVLGFGITFRGALEHVSGWQGGNKKGDGTEHKSQGAPGSAMFEFGRSFGHCELALAAVNICEGTGYDLVRPQKWQKEFQLPKLDYSARKRYCRDLAQELFPDVKVTLATGDALLLAEYCRRKYTS